VSQIDLFSVIGYRSESHWRRQPNLEMAVRKKSRSDRKKRSILRNPRAYYIHCWPSPKAGQRLRDRVREITDQRASGEDVERIIAKLNPVLRGWGNYFRTRTCRREFHQMDDFVYRR
jgi:hypothetical protein